MKKSIAILSLVLLAAACAEKSKEQKMEALRAQITEKKNAAADLKTEIEKLNLRNTTPDMRLYDTNREANPQPVGSLFRILTPVGGRAWHTGAFSPTERLTDAPTFKLIPADQAYEANALVYARERIVAPPVEEEPRDDEDDQQEEEAPEAPDDQQQPEPQEQEQQRRQQQQQRQHQQQQPQQQQQL